MYKQAIIFITNFLLSVNLVSSNNSESCPYTSFSLKEKTSLNKGEPVHRIEQFKDSEGHQAGRGVAYIIVRDVAEKIWKVILDYDHYQGFYPQVDSAKLTKKEKNHYYVHFVLESSAQP